MDRRKFVTALATLPFGGFTATTSSAEAASITSVGIEGRPAAALERRRQAAHQSLGVPIRTASSAYAGSANRPFTKGMLHNRLLDYDNGQHRRLVEAIAQNDINLVESLCWSEAPLANPIASNGFLDAGRDPSQFHAPSLPQFDDAEFAWEAAELSWAAVCRDLPFSLYEENSLAEEALSTLYHSINAEQVLHYLFQPDGRLPLPGPVVSQFLLQPASLGGISQEPWRVLTEPNVDFLVDFESFFKVQNGGLPSAKPKYSARYNLPNTGRDLASLVHKDFPAQYFMYAAQALFQLGSDALNPSNPYCGRMRQSAFTSYGMPHCFALLNRVSCLALQVAWYLKWRVYWRIRPEEYFGLLRVSSRAETSFSPPNYDFFVRSVESLRRRFGDYLLPQSYPEGCPMHPAFPAGHAMIAGACGVVLKYFFNGNFEVPGPKRVSQDDRLVDYGGILTIDDEIDKLVWNISFGRSFAGVHWRSDCIHGIRLGEQVAGDLLSESVLFQAEPDVTFHYRNFFQQAAEI